MPRFSGKTVIVTGSSSGIGAATAVLFAKEGANVTITGRNEDALKATHDAMLIAGAKEENILIVVGDVVEQNTREGIVNKTVSKWGNLDILVNNFNNKTKVSISNKVFKFIFFSVMELIRLARPHLVSSKGEIVNVSSIAGLNFGFKTSTYYAISKAALDQMTRAVALELIEVGVRVNSVRFVRNFFCCFFYLISSIKKIRFYTNLHYSPGFVCTKFFQNIGLSSSASDMAYSYWESNHDIIPSGKVGTPNDIASVIAFLADRTSSSYIVGQTVVADGGSSIVMAASTHDMGKILSQ
uniref:3-oxoacyl-[acyl-carrier-protein] reductase n=1 Tax=Heterorhabditis bacteriophora TaxID=37862 RepID=A0A1I7XJ96_HETBA